MDKGGKTEEVLFPVVVFTHNGKRIHKEIVAGELPNHDQGIDWWDYWFTIGPNTFQLCGKYEHPHRMAGGLVIYVYRKGNICDEDRIAEIEDVRIELKALGRCGFVNRKNH